MIIMNNLIIMNHLILNQKFLNERRRTIHIFTVVCVFEFCSIAFYLFSIILFERFIIHLLISNVFLICLNTSLLADLFFQISSKKQQNSFPDQLGLQQITQARTVFIAQRFLQFYLFVCHDNLLKSVKSLFVTIKIEFFNIRFYYFFSFSSLKISSSIYQDEILIRLIKFFNLCFDQKHELKTMECAKT